MRVEIVASTDKLNRVLPEIGGKFQDILTVKKKPMSNLVVIRLQAGDDYSLIQVLVMLHRNGSIQSFKVS